MVGGAVLESLEEPTRLLSARRTSPPKFAGMWEFPGGKVEPGESAENALHRELREELGIGVRLGAELDSELEDGWRLNANASMRVWFVEITEGVPAPLEDHDELRWVELGSGAQTLGLPWIPADLPIVRRLLETLAHQSPSGIRTR